MENLTLSVTHPSSNRGLTLLSVKGSIDTLTAPDFEGTLLSLLGGHPIQLILDLREANYISSAGWGILIKHLKWIRSQKGDLVLAGMRAEVSEVYGLLEFNLILRSFPDVPTAVEKAFGPGPNGPELQPLPRGRVAESWGP
jgi:anti-anti-sigma factor